MPARESSPRSSGLRAREDTRRPGAPAAQHRRWRQGEPIGDLAGGEQPGGHGRQRSRLGRRSTRSTNTSGELVPGASAPSEEALVGVVQEACVSVVSTRKVERLVEQLGIGGMSKSHVSRLCAQLDE
jgi:hypothetical protein